MQGENVGKMTENKFKYQEWIDKLTAEGCQMPPLFKPNNMKTCRFAFASSNQQNHIPQYVHNPKRMLQDLGKGKADTSFLALSCFANNSQAEFFFSNLQKAFKNAKNSISDALVEGILTNEDGMKTSANQSGHFDFYEYEQCDLNKLFKITRRL